VTYEVGPEKANSSFFVQASLARLRGVFDLLDFIEILPYPSELFENGVALRINSVQTQGGYNQSELNKPYHTKESEQRIQYSSDSAAYVART
jgi:hypothetical protein